MKKFKLLAILAFGFASLINISAQATQIIIKKEEAEKAKKTLRTAAAIGTGVAAYLSYVAWNNLAKSEENKSENVQDLKSKREKFIKAFAIAGFFGLIYTQTKDE